MSGLAQAYRVVDAHNQGWHPAGDGHGGSKWSADYGFDRGLEDVATLDELEAARGPLRPVLPVTDEDEAEIRRLFTAAKRKAVTTLAAALAQVFHDLREEAGGLDNMTDSFAYATRTLLAGREGSWESEVLKSLVWFGDDLNLDQKNRMLTVKARRAADPSKRVDRQIRDELAVIIHRWVTDPQRYTEVAETLTGIVSWFADEAGGTGGWRLVADQWLQPGALDATNMQACYNLLYSRSEHFNPF